MSNLVIVKTRLSSFIFLEDSGWHCMRVMCMRLGAGLMPRPPLDCVWA